MRAAIASKLGAFLAASQSDCFAVMKDGKLVYDWFGGFGAPDRQHIVFSITKSMASLLAGVLVGEGVIDLQRPITDYLPELSNSAYAGATIRHLLDMQIASGFL
jgi:CubicO group peptidase (beta-lactamase class C family)